MAQGQCIRQPVPTAKRNVKFPLNLQKEDQSIAESAIQSIEHNDINRRLGRIEVDGQDMEK